MSTLTVQQTALIERISKMGAVDPIEFVTKNLEAAGELVGEADADGRQMHWVSAWALLTVHNADLETADKDQEQPILIRYAHAFERLRTVLSSPQQNVAELTSSYKEFERLGTEISKRRLAVAQSMADIWGRLLPQLADIRQKIEAEKETTEQRSVASSFFLRIADLAKEAGKSAVTWLTGVDWEKHYKLAELYDEGALKVIWTPVGIRPDSAPKVWKLVINLLIAKGRPYAAWESSNKETEFEPYGTYDKRNLFVDDVQAIQAVLETAQKGNTSTQFDW